MVCSFDSSTALITNLCGILAYYQLITLTGHRSCFSLTTFSLLIYAIFVPFPGFPWSSITREPEGVLHHDNAKQIKWVQLTISAPINSPATCIFMSIICIHTWTVMPSLVPCECKHMYSICHYLCAIVESLFWICNISCCFPSMQPHVCNIKLLSLALVTVSISVSK